MAGEIRKHVVASLQEAETHRQMERIQQDLDMARTIQQDLLPKQPLATPRFDIAGWNQPADATGGDYFDWQELPDGRIAVSLADVSGHGIGPALVMAVCRAYARASFPAARDLPEVMTRLNELLVKDLPSERYVTFVVAWLDPANSKVELLSAGHGPLLLYNVASDKFQSIEPQGIPFGLFPGFPYGSPHCFEMAPGDLLVLTTMGSSNGQTRKTSNSAWSGSRRPSALTSISGADKNGKGKSDNNSVERCVFPPLKFPNQREPCT